MSDVEIYREFKDFGNKIELIAILTLICIIATIVGWITWIGIVISIGMSIIIIIYLLLVIRHIKRAGRMLDNNQDLLGFPLKFILGKIYKIIGYFGIMQISYFIIRSIGKVNTVTLFIILIIWPIGIGLIILGSILRLLAWRHLRSFFENNAPLFPPYMTFDGISGTKLCKMGCIFDMLIIIPLIGDFLRIIGYFKLASLRSLTGAPDQPTYQPSQQMYEPSQQMYEPSQQVYEPSEPMPMYAPEQTPSVKYCTNCGKDISKEVRYCPGCGVEIE